MASAVWRAISEATSEPDEEPKGKNRRNGKAPAIFMDEIVTLKELVARMGADHVKALIGVLDK